MAYWFDHHAPLVASEYCARRCASAVMSRLTAYRRRSSRPCVNRAAGPEDYDDGVAQLWGGDSLEDVAAATADPASAGVEAGRLLLEDERKFIDLSRSAAVVGRGEGDLPESLAHSRPSRPSRAKAEGAQGAQRQDGGAGQRPPEATASARRKSVDRPSATAASK